MTRRGLKHIPLFDQINKLWAEDRKEEAVLIAVNAIRADPKISHTRGWRELCLGPVGKFIRSEDGQAFISALPRGRDSK